MAERDRFTQRSDERGASAGPRPERAGAYSGEGGGPRGGGRGEFGGYGGRGEPGRGGTQRGGRDDERSWAAAQSLGTGAAPYGPASGEAGYGSEDPSRRWHEGGWSERERWEAGGGTGWTGPGGLGGAGGTAYGRPGGSTAGDWRSRQGAPGGGAAGVSRNRGPKGWQRSDERIHDDVCERLAGEPGIDPSDVTVEVHGGKVVLGGTVPDRGMKYRIEDIVDGTTGVADVDNRLRVSRGVMGGLFGGAGTTSEARGGETRGGTRGSLLGRLFGFGTGTRLSDVMTRDPRTVGPDETLTKVAQAMKAQDVGAIPVCTGRTLVGMITDRDIVVRAVAAGRSLEQTKASEVMSTQVHACYEDEDVETALDTMGDLKVRRIPVIDRSNQLVGIVSLGDFAQRETGDVEDALQGISKPA